jgi:hypothetical protein
LYLDVRFSSDEQNATLLYHLAGQSRESCMMGKGTRIYPLLERLPHPQTVPFLVQIQMELAIQY